ncbi:hypothetical protein LXA43DRAFT_55488 [Ganoderma leucocontextum]|nr:hypothetical protein LXA43DRAFT_55488 [Ganoderma leucocontextum]
MAPVGIAVAQLLYLSLSFTPVRSGLVNITVDDQLGDSTTGLIPEYAPNDGAWVAGSPTENCPTCRITPSILDLTQIHEQTWHDTTYLPSETPVTITVHFTGSAVYVFNILPNTLPDSTLTSASISFSIDGEDAGTFTRSPDSSSTILYNQLVYHNTALNDGLHILIMTPGDNSLTLFDYLLYTTQGDDTSSANLTSNNIPPSTSSIIPPSTSAPHGSSQSFGSSFSPLVSPSTPNNTSQSSSFSTFASPSPTGSSQSSSSSTTTSMSTPNGSSRSPSSNTPTSTSTPNGSSQSSSPSTPIGAVIGAVLGAVALLLGVAVGVFFLCRRRTRSRATHMHDGGYEDSNGGRSEGEDRGGDGESSAQSMVPTTPISPLRLLDGAATHDPSRLAPDVLGADSTHGTPPAIADAASPLTADWSSKRHAELAWRLETLQRTRSDVLSSPTRASRLSDVHEGGRGTETAIRELEAEMADLRGVLTSLSARLANEHREDPDLLPAYAE